MRNRQARLLAFSIAALALAATPASSNEGAQSHAEKPEGKKEKKPDGLFSSADNEVPLPALIAPLVSNGRIIAHLYLFLEAVTPNANTANTLKDKMPYILDDLILTIFDNVPSVPNRDAEPNYKVLIDALQASMNRVMGGNFVTQVKVGKIDTAPY